jgi:hypothetical protein
MNLSDDFDLFFSELRLEIERGRKAVGILKKLHDGLDPHRELSDACVTRFTRFQDVEHSVTLGEIRNIIDRVSRERGVGCDEQD